MAFRTRVGLKVWLKLSAAEYWWPRFGPCVHGSAMLPKQLTPSLLLQPWERRPASALLSVSRLSILISNRLSLLRLPLVPIQLLRGLYASVPTATFGSGKYCIIFRAAGSIKLPGLAGIA